MNGFEVACWSMRLGGIRCETAANETSEKEASRSVARMTRTSINVKERNEWRFV